MERGIPGATCIELHGEFYALPPSIKALRRWAAGVRGDSRLEPDARNFALVLAELMRQAIATGAGAIVAPPGADVHVMSWPS